MKKITISKAALAAVTALLIPCSVGFARTLPGGFIDAGQLLSELEPERHVLPNPQIPDVTLDLAKPPHNIETEKIYVKKANLNWKEGVKLVETKDTDHHAYYANEQEHLSKKVHAAIDGLYGKEMTFSELVEAAEIASNTLRNLGYPTALVYMPRQNMQNGELTLNVMLGTIGDVQIINNSKLTDKRNAGFLAALKKGDLIYNSKINRRLLIMNELAGVKTTASLAPGSKPGTANLIVKSDCLEKSGGALYVDNWGSRNTGRYRYGISYHYNNLNHTGDQLQANYLISNKKDSKNYSFQYETPIDREGTKAHLLYSESTYDVMGKNGQYTGGARTWEFGITQPMERDLTRSNFMEYAYRHRDINDTMDFSGRRFRADKYSDSFEVEVKGYTRRLKDMFSYNLSSGIGHLGVTKDDASINQTADKWFQKSNANFYYVHNFSNVTSMHVSGSAQWSWSNNLDSSEDFYIGGPTAVRAFASGEANGDCGALGTVEFRYRTDVKGLTLTAFYDVGYVRYNRHKLDGWDGSNSRTLAGAGIGLIYQASRDWYAKLDWAKPLSNSYSESYGRANHNMLWFRLVKQI